jgi:hypothetical protein
MHNTMTLIDLANDATLKIACGFFAVWGVTLVVLNVAFQ